MVFSMVSHAFRRFEREGGEDTIKPQVFFPALPLALSLPPQLPSHLAPLSAEGPRGVRAEPVKTRLRDETVACSSA